MFSFSILVILLQLIILFLIVNKIGFNAPPIPEFFLLIFGQLAIVSFYYQTTNIEIPFDLFLISLLISLATFYLFIPKIKKENAIFKYDIKPRIGFLNFTKISFYLYCLIHLFFSILVLQSGNGGERVVLFKSLPVLSVFLNLLRGPAIIHISTVLSVNRKSFLGYIKLFLILILLALSGAKSSVLVALIEINFYSRILYGKTNIGFLKTLFLGSFFFGITLFIYLQSNNSVFRDFYSFILYRGDIYNNLLAGGEDLFLQIKNYYSGTAIFYPFYHLLKFVGINLFPHPLGTVISSQANASIALDDAAGGAITPFFIYIYIFLGRNPILFFFFSIICGYFSAKLFSLGYKILKMKELTSYRLIISYWLLNSWYLIRDPTVFSYYYSPLLIFAIFIFFEAKFFQNN